MCLQIQNDFIDALQILVSVQILGQLCEFSFHEFKSLLFVVKLLYCLLDFSLDALNFLCLVLVLNTLISYFLLLLEYFLVDWFLVLFPFVMEVLKFLFDHGDLILQHSKVLSTKLLQFLKYFLLLFCLLLESLECLPKVFLLLGSFLFSSSAFLVVEAQSIGFSFDCINLSNKALYL